jgi:DNA-binding PadR family transcriptional regulator
MASKNLTQKILEFIKTEKPEQLIQIQSYIRAVNGSGVTKLKGYYSSNISRLVDNGLLDKRSRGVYEVTDLGELYIEDRRKAQKIIRGNRDSIRIQRAIQKIDEIREGILLGEFQEGDEITIKM